MSRLTLLLPALDRAIAADRSDWLTRWISHGDRHTRAPAGRETALRECFRFIGTAIPVAALTRSIEAKDAAATLWLRADPAWMAADAVTVRMLACGNLDLSPSESDSLAYSLRPLFGDAGFLLEPATPSHWYLRCPAGAQLPAFDPPQEVLGDDLAPHLPAGDAGIRWRHLLNEAQVILHNHPVNADRTRRGLTPANSLWFWGAGKLPDWVQTDFSQVYSEDDVVSALARLAQVSCAKPQPRLVDELAKDSSVLLDLAALRHAAAFDAGWCEPIQAALRSRRISALHLLFESGQRIVFKRAHRLRFWRRLRVAHDI